MATEVHAFDGWQVCSLPCDFYGQGPGVADCDAYLIGLVRELGVDPSVVWRVVWQSIQNPHGGAKLEYRTRSRRLWNRVRRDGRYPSENKSQRPSSASGALSVS